MGLVQDEPSESDRVFMQEGITYVVNGDLFEKVKPIKVDFADFSSSLIWGKTLHREDVVKK